MTNLIGQALMILAINCYTNTATNQVADIHPEDCGYCRASENGKVCVVFYTKPEIVDAQIVKETTIGTTYGPVFTLREYKATERGKRGVGNTIYNDGTEIIWRMDISSVSQKG